MRRRWVTTLGACAVVAARMLIGGPTASAQTTAGCTITVADVTTPAGATRVVVGDKFPTTPHTVPIMLSGGSDQGNQIGLATVDDSGKFTVPVTIPVDTPHGAHTISVSCGVTGAAATSRIDVTAASSVRRQATDDDNVDGAGLVLAGALAIVAGLALTTRRRRAQRVVAP